MGTLTYTLRQSKNKNRCSDTAQTAEAEGRETVGTGCTTRKDTGGNQKGSEKRRSEIEKSRWYECRKKEREEKKGEDAFEDIEVESTLKDKVSSVRGSENPEKSKPVKPRNTRGKKTKTEVEVVPEV